MRLLPIGLPCLKKPARLPIPPQRPIVLNSKQLSSASQPSGADDASSQCSRHKCSPDKRPHASGRRQHHHTGCHTRSQALMYHHSHWARAPSDHRPCGIISMGDSQIRQRQTHFFTLFCFCFPAFLLVGLFALCRPAAIVDSPPHDCRLSTPLLPSASVV
jgi:hypothetical protein